MADISVIAPDPDSGSILHKLVDDGWQKIFGIVTDPTSGVEFATVSARNQVFALLQQYPNRGFLLTPRPYQLAIPHHSVDKSKDIPCLTIVRYDSTKDELVVAW